MRSSRPIFVVGYMHSGTTLVLNVLRNHADLFCPDHETKYFQHLDLVRRHVADAENGPVGAADSFARRVVEHGFPLFETPPRRPAPLSDLQAGRAFRRAMDDLAHARARSRWVEKTPTHIFHVNQIVASIPDALFIEMVRDPRDVLASKKTRVESVWTTERYTADQRPLKYLEKAFDPFWDALSWTSAVRAGSRSSQTDRWLRLRYEDLVADPHALVAEACEFLELYYSPDLLDIDRGVPADPDELGSAARGVAATSVGRWVDVLDPVEVAICQRVCRKEMVRLDYRPVPAARSLRVLGRVVVRSAPEMGMRLLHRLRLGGVAYLGEVVKSYLRRLRALLSR